MKICSFNSSRKDLAYLPHGWINVSKFSHPYANSLGYGTNFLVFRTGHQIFRWNRLLALEHSRDLGFKKAHIFPKFNNFFVYSTVSPMRLEAVQNTFAHILSLKKIIMSIYNKYKVNFDLPFFNSSRPPVTVGINGCSFRLSHTHFDQFL